MATNATRVQEAVSNGSGNVDSQLDGFVGDWVRSDVEKKVANAHIILTLFIIAIHSICKQYDRTVVAVPRKAVGDMIPVRLATTIVVPVSRNGTLKSETDQTTADIDFSTTGNA